MQKYIVTLVTLFYSLFLVAQEPADNKLALEYYRSGEFDKAADLYTQLYKSTGSRTHFNYLIKSLTELEEYPKAIKVVKQQIKSQPEDLSFYVDLGILYKKNGQKEKAEEQYNKAIGKLGVNTQQVINLGHRFLQEQEFAFAVQTYQAGQRLFKPDYGFHTELANVYFYLRDYNKMIAEYLALLSESELYLETVQTRLQNLIVNDIDNSLSPLLKQELIARIQKEPNKLIFQEMLIWQFIQEKDFRSAYIHATAIDKRFKENGERLYELGTLALSNNDIESAIKCFTYIVNKGEVSPYYVESREKLLHAKLLGLEQNQGTPQDAEISELALAYKSLLEEIGISYRSINLVLDYAKVLAYHAHQTDSAINMLTNAQNQPNLKQNQRTEIEMQLAECFLFNGDIWDANLEFAKIEKRNSHNPAGHEAKFRRAEIAYYTGDFLFSEALLDILKASTSKLISNDAFELAQLINDNVALDTSTTAMELFAQADYLLYRKQDSAALVLYDSVVSLFPTHSLADEILLRKAELFSKLNNFEESAKYYQQIVDDYGYDVLADNSLFALGRLYEEQLFDKTKAQELYKRILTEHPSSIFLPEARARFRKLRGDTIN